MMFPEGSRSRLVMAAVAGALVAAGVALILAREAPADAAQTQPAAPAKSGAVATVEGQVITVEELDGAISAELSKLEDDIYNLRKNRLDGLIGEKLLAREAAARGVDVQQLIATEVAAKAGSVTDEEVNAFFEANKARLPSRPDIKDQIRQYLLNQKTQARGQAYVAELRSRAKVDVNLPTPPVRRATLDIDGAPIRGDRNAPVTIVEFTDFHCPFCKRVQPTLLQILEKYPGKVRLVFKDLPLDSLHPQARKVSEAASCANDQNRFWEFHDRIFEGAPDASPEHLRRLATDAGLDVAAFEQCLQSGKHQARIQAGVELGSSLGITGTPAFFINGRPLSGAQPFEAFVKIIDEELQLGAK